MSHTPEKTTPDGTYQNIARIHKILDALASSGNEGMRMTDVVRVTGINKSAAHRALTGLAAYGMATHDADSSRFYLGDQIFGWMHRARERFSLADRIRPYLTALADQLEDTVNFSVRRGDYAVCYARAEGCSPVQFLTLKVGDARPLGAGSGTLAIGAFLPDADIERIIEEHDAERLVYGITKEMMRRNIALTRQNGYAVHPGLIAKEMRGAGVPIRNSGGAVVASFSVVALQARLQERRLEEVVKRMQEEAVLVEQQLAALLDDI